MMASGAAHSAVACIQARLGSKRLPGKVLEEIGGVPVLAHVTQRAQAAGLQPWVLCPTMDKDAIRSALPGGALLWHWPGAEENVLGRFAAFARQKNYTAIVRLTSDCPWVDVDTIWKVSGLVEAGYADYASSNDAHGHPWIDGYDVEAFTTELLERAEEEVEFQGANGEHMREHVTPLIRQLAVRPWQCTRVTPDRHRRRWTLDTADDLAWFRAVAARIDVTPPVHPTYEELMALEDECPDLHRGA